MLAVRCAAARVGRRHRLGPVRLEHARLRSPATRSNQYQPPSMKGESGSVELTLDRRPPSTSIASTRWATPARIRAVDDDGGLARSAERQPTLSKYRPAAPVARREGVEVGAERDAAAARAPATRRRPTIARPRVVRPRRHRRRRLGLLGDGGARRTALLPSTYSGTGSGRGRRARRPLQHSARSRRSLISAPAVTLARAPRHLGEVRAQLVVGHATAPTPIAMCMSRYWYVPRRPPNSTSVSRLGQLAVAPAGARGPRRC